MSGLTPPWDRDDAAMNAAHIRTHPTGYREMRDLAVWCPCSSRKRRRLVRVFAGAVDDGHGQVLMAPSYTLRGRNVPALAEPAPKPGAEWWPLYAHCGLCRCGVVVFYPDAECVLQRRRAEGSLVSLVLQFGKPTREQPGVGEPYEYVEGDTWSDGPCSSWLLHVGPPTLGRIAQT